MRRLIAIVALGVATTAAIGLVLQRANSPASITESLPASQSDEPSQAAASGSGDRAGGSEPDATAPAATTSDASRTTSTTTTTAASISTTPIVPFDGPVIAFPAADDQLAWDAKNTFVFNQVPGANSYCVSLASNDSVFRRCTKTADYSLIRSSKNVAPGPVDVTVEVFGPDGRALASEQMSILLVLSNMALEVQPNRLYLFQESQLPVKSRKVPTAEVYCWVVVQGDVESNDPCLEDRSYTFDPRTLSDRFEPGEATVIYSAWRGELLDELVGEQRVTIQLGDVNRSN